MENMNVVKANFGGMIEENKEKAFDLLYLRPGDKLAVIWEDEEKKTFEIGSNFVPYLRETAARYKNAFYWCGYYLKRQNIVLAKESFSRYIHAATKELPNDVPIEGACREDGKNLMLHKIVAGKNIFFKDGTVSVKKVAKAIHYREGKVIKEV